jgi:hypothetical protein
LDQSTAQGVLDEPISKADYDYKTHDVCPSADPTAFSSIQKLMKAQAVLELLPLGTINVQVATKRILEAQEQPNMEELLNQGPPPPDPKQIEMQQKQQLEQQKAAMKAQEDSRKSEMAMRDQEFQQRMEAQSRAMEAAYKEKMDQLDLMLTQAKGMQDLRQKEMAHSQSMRHKEQQAAQKAQEQANKASQQGSNK